jgi:two-component sensor histidine kinase
MDIQRPGFDFLAGGGEMGALMRAFDWDNSCLGPPDKWPQSLRVTVRLLLNTGHPMFIWWGPDLIQFYNDAYRRTMGPERHPSALGQRGRECWAEIWPIIGPQIDYVMSGKGSTWDENRLVPVTRHGRREDVWWTYSYGPIDVEGGVGGVLVVCNDVTAQHRANEALLEQSRMLRLINDELQHRVKNTLAVISAIASQTLRGTNNDPALKKFQDRLAAFATAHDSLTVANWAAGDVRHIVQGALAPHRSIEGRFVISGAEIILGAKPAVSLALALHELATNAVKYGALSDDSGRVEILWEEKFDGDASRFHFLWQEIDGPAVSPPVSQGFGSQLIKRVLTADFGSDVEVRYEPSGLICRLSAPMAEIRAPLPLVDL